MALKERMDKRVASGGGPPHLPRGGWRRLLASPRRSPTRKWQRGGFNFLGLVLSGKREKILLTRPPALTATYVAGRWGRKTFPPCRVEPDEFF
jgi:hypothetical protein